MINNSKTSFKKIFIFFLFFLTIFTSVSSSGNIIDIDNVFIFKDSDTKVNKIKLNMVNRDPSISNETTINFRITGVTGTHNITMNVTKKTQSFEYELSTILDSFNSLNNNQNYVLVMDSSKGFSFQKSFKLNDIEEGESSSSSNSSSSSSSSSSTNIIQRFEINGIIYNSQNQCSQIDLSISDEIKTTTYIESSKSYDGVRLSLKIRQSGNTISAKVDSFDLKKDIAQSRNIDLIVGNSINYNNPFEIKVEAFDKSLKSIGEFSCQVYTKRLNKDLQIENVILNPRSIIRAGQNGILSLEVKNTGASNLKNVEISVKIDEFDFKEKLYIPRLNNGEVKPTDSIVFYVPKDTKDGLYNIEIYASEENKDFEKYIHTFRVSNEESLKEKDDIIIRYRNNFDFFVNEKNTQYLTIENGASKDKLISIRISREPWMLSSNVAPSVKNLRTDDVFEFLFTIVPKENYIGENTFRIYIKEEDKLEKTLTLNANIIDLSNQNKAQKTITKNNDVIILLLLFLGIGLFFLALYSILKTRKNIRYTDKNEKILEEDYTQIPSTKTTTRKVIKKTTSNTTSKKEDDFF